MKSRFPKPHLISVALLALAAQAQAQTAPAPAEAQKLEKVVVTGSLIKRTDKETPAVVQIISRSDIKNSGFATIEDLLRNVSAVDSSSIQDGAATGFVGGLSTLSLRGFGSQGTLVLINGRRIAPVAAVDINFGRGSLISVNTIPRGAVDRIEILKDGASALYGSDAMAGVVNYVLRKDFQGVEANAGFNANDKGVGKSTTAGASFGFGDLDSKGFNVFGGIELFKRDPVMHRQLKDRGDNALYDQFLTVQGSLENFTPYSSVSTTPNYYAVPATQAQLGAFTVLPNGFRVQNNSLSGVNFIGAAAGCPTSATVGQGYPARPTGFQATTPSLPTGLCRYDPDSADEAISAQERVNAILRGTLALSGDLTAYADLMFSKTKSTENGLPRNLTGSLVSAASPVAATWTRLDGTIGRANAIILPVGHPDNITNGTSNPRPVQVIMRFGDLSSADINDLQSLRATVGVQGRVGEWDIDSALLLTRQDNKRVQEDRLRNSLLSNAIANRTYRFNGQQNSPEAIATIASDAVNEGESTIMAADVRGSRDIFAMKGGMAAAAIGLEARKEELSSTPDANYVSGDYIGLVANGATGDRTSYAAFGELRLPVLKSVEVQAAARFENYSDFGNSTTGKLGFKWDILPSLVAVRGTAATGFRAPSITQIGNSFALSFHQNFDRRVIDNVRCDNSNPAAPVSRSIPPNSRDCNVVNFNLVPASEVRPGALATFVGANADLQPEESKSFTFGAIFSPNRYVDLSLDYWYFHRSNEIRAGGAAEIMDLYNANPTQFGDLVLRDPNPATWLPGVPNSGPILAVRRRYDNFNYTKTAGIDYDLAVRFPTTEVGRFSARLTGTYTKRFDRKQFDNSPIERLVGTSTSDIPRTRASLQVNWVRENWNAWTRLNHIDKVERVGTTVPCLASTSVPNQIRQSTGGCFIGAQESFDLGVSYSGFKNWTIGLSALNLTNDYGRSQDVPHTFTYWEQGTTGQLGRRFGLSVSYAMR